MSRNVCGFNWFALHSTHKQAVQQRGMSPETAPVSEPVYDFSDDMHVMGCVRMHMQSFCESNIQQFFLACSSWRFVREGRDWDEYDLNWYTEVWNKPFNHVLARVDLLCLCWVFTHLSKSRCVSTLSYMVYVIPYAVILNTTKSSSWLVFLYHIQAVSRNF